MQHDKDNTHFTLAYEYVSQTACPVYLTGKAGTGKTTFLKYVKAHCPKKMMVVAPTGVAAIQAGGVTMHSFFQLPFGPYIAGLSQGFGLNSSVVNRHSLLKNLRLSQMKRDIIRDLELLIIDEVSMLRSDMLDAIDTILRTIRRQQKPFGGVQVLFIGDLYQLPPVVQPADKEILDQHYRSPFFFHAHVFDEIQPVFIELKKIYRQNEQRFIDLLNGLRNQNLQPDDFTLLESLYQPNFRDTSGQYITLTSHNHQADSINRDELNRLSSPERSYEGEIKQDFGDKLLPTERVLRLKEGAQVMFIRNDSSPEKRYYNGKIARVHQLNTDSILVKFPDTGETLQVEKETWDHITYQHNNETGDIEEKVLGQFVQYPLRLAWAITIHKSQGLTFRHAIIDAGASFAPGQVYVALSRCTALDGLVLKSRITPRALHQDERIQDFSLREMNEETLSRRFAQERFSFHSEQLLRLFSLDTMLEATLEFRQHTLACLSLPDRDAANRICADLMKKIRYLQETAVQFGEQLKGLLQPDAFESRRDLFLERSRSAVAFFSTRIHEDLILPLEAFQEGLRSASRIKKYLGQVEDFRLLLWNRVHALQQAHFEGSLLSDPARHLQATTKKVQLATKKAKGDSAKESYAYFMAGKSIEEIAGLRNLASSTIEGHLFEYVKKGELDIFRLLTLEQLERIHASHRSTPVAGLKELRENLGNEFSYAQIRMALDYTAPESA